MFGFGDLDVLTAAETGIERFRMILDPIGFKKAMLDAKHEYEVDMERSGWQPSPPIRAAREPVRRRGATGPASGAGRRRPRAAPSPRQSPTPGGRRVRPATRLGDAPRPPRSGPTRTR